MAHMIPQHQDMGMQGHPNHPTLQSALQIDPNHHPPPPQSVPAPAPPPATSPPSRKRKKTDSEHGEPQHPVEPRRLRRSHEACARCRSKKIKCDSKHPRCTACASAGVQCHQEDRHRQTLVARGHTELVERQLLLCVALLKRHIPNFELIDIEGVAAREGVEVDQQDANTVAGTMPYPHSASAPNPRGYPLRPEPQAREGSPPRGYPPFPSGPGQPMMPPPGYPHMPPMPYGYNPHMMPPPGYPPPPMHPPFQQPLHPQSHSGPSSHQEPRESEPLPHDLSNNQALAKNFGVSPAIVGNLKLAPAAIDTEDLAVGLSGLLSRRDFEISEPSLPRDAAKWLAATIRPDITSSPTAPTAPPTPLARHPTAEVKPMTVWLPKDRSMTQQVVEVYFTRLNVHRPVFTRLAFEQNLDALYRGAAAYDPGFICSVYLILALGTLSELNHRVNHLLQDGQPIASTASALKGIMPADWPSQEEFFDRALAVKPDLRVTLSSLQALILLHWYLYTERQGRTLWRLVGSLVRLAIELGLHHDPTMMPTDDAQAMSGQPPPPVFSDEECQLRIRLWAIVLVHDRGTSILLGRPLAIAPYDSNTPRPQRSSIGDVSEHFVLSAPIAEIQADIINSLYAPTRQSKDSIVRHASRISKSINEFVRLLPDHYKYYFHGTDEWPPERRKKLVEDITEDQGLTLLKLGIARILLLRALFSSKELPFNSRHRALIDAIVTSHNIIIVHQQLIKFPDIAFFVSPIPLHIAAMVILYGHMSKCNRLPREVALEDVWMALDMLPKFRWRWERKDLKGGHPLIAKLAEQVLKVSLNQVSPTTPPMLLSEAQWDTDNVLSPRAQNAPSTTPTLGPAQYPASQYSKQSPGPVGTNSPGGRNGTTNGDSRDEKLAEVPPGLFYPFYPETNPAPGTSAATLLSVSQPIGSYGYQASQDQYIVEEKDRSLVALPTSSIPVWPPSGHDPRMMAPYQGPSHL